MVAVSLKKAAAAENRYIKIPAKLEKKEKKLIQSIFADFEKVAQGIPGATKNKPQSNTATDVFGSGVVEVSENLPFEI